MVYLIFGVALIMVATCGNGIIMFAYYYFCDPIKAGIVSKYDKLTPRFVQDVTGYIPGMSGTITLFVPFFEIFSKNIPFFHCRHFHFRCIFGFIEHSVGIVAFVIWCNLQRLHSTSKVVCKYRWQCKFSNENDNRDNWIVLCPKWFYHWAFSVGIPNGRQYCGCWCRCHCWCLFTWVALPMGKQTGKYFLNDSE